MLPIWNFLKSKSHKKKDYWLTRFVFLRFLGLVYFIAFLTTANHVVPLLGEGGLLPAENYLGVLEGNFENKWGAFRALPSVFWFYLSDSFLLSVAWLGVLLSLIVLLGYANIPIMATLWFFYMSIVHIGQRWYAFGWEIQLLETGFLGLLMVPLWEARPFPKLPTPAPIVWLLWWLTFRIYMGSGLIKVKGDACWTDYSCMDYHYETQPVPGPFSRWFHFLPKWFHKIEVLFNHFSELIVPLFIFAGKYLRHIAGVVLILFQMYLILTGNLSFLNWLTILPAIALFDDSFLRRILPRFLSRKAKEASEKASISKTRIVVTWVAFVVMIIMSITVVQNLMSQNQAMNTSFNQLHLVNTYGAFGSITKERNELIIFGSEDGEKWEEYEFKVKPGDLDRLPWITPYHYRLDWVMWFAAFQSLEQNPWLLNLVWKLLHNDAELLGIMRSNPFFDSPPRYIKIDFYNYKFSKEGEVWERKYLRNWLRPLSKDNEEFRNIIKRNGWE
jgi:hypothetical protein